MSFPPAVHITTAMYEWEVNFSYGEQNWQILEAKIPDSV